MTKSQKSLLLGVWNELGVFTNVKYPKRLGVFMCQIRLSKG
jgi:hypothetical protein